MIDGTMNTLQKIWSLVGNLCNYLESGSKLNDKSNHNGDFYNVRNSQLSMITFNLQENFNVPSYLVAINKIIKFLKVRCN
jgi:hypothetical protein